MAIIQGTSKASSGSYQIDQSIRFNDDDSAYLYRTPSVVGNRETWTWSSWVKLGYLNTGAYALFNAYLDDTNRTTLYYQSNQLIGQNILSGIADSNIQTSAVYRDSSAWYHVMWVYDSTNATAANRSRFYINGASETTTTTYPSPSATSLINYTCPQNICRLNYSTPQGWFDGYMAEINFIDGSALDPTSFGETNDDGVWVPIKYTGAYGTNGFYITGENSAALGTDYSGNSNTFTSSGLTTDDQVTDTPTNNYATWNPLGKNANTVLADGNLFINAVSNSYGAPSTIPVTDGQDKVYVEFTKNAGTAGYPYFGVWNPNTRTFPLGTEIPGITVGKLDTGLATNQGYIYNNNGFTGPHASLTFSNGDVGMMAVERSTGKVWWGKNGTWGDVGSGAGDPAAGTNPSTTVTVDIDWFIGCSTYSNASLNVNFGQSGFTYTPPTGFSALSTANLPAPAIKDGSKYFDIATYTGNGATQSITGVPFQPDLAWVKSRSYAYNHQLQDAVRGIGNSVGSNLTTAETSYPNTITSLNADGFTLGTDVGMNANTQTYVAWMFKELAGFFDIVSYTGDGLAGHTVAHALGVSPELALVKDLDVVNGWGVYHKGSGAGDILFLASNSAATASATAWSATEPDASNLTIGANGTTNNSGDDYIAYLFASKTGLCKVGSYTGNGSTNGPMINCGGRPRFLIIKRDNGLGNWFMYDRDRQPYNNNYAWLRADSAAVESAAGSQGLDILSSGFKLRASNTDVNASGGTYIYIAIFDAAFGGVGVAPATAL